MHLLPASLVPHRCGWPPGARFTFRPLRSASSWNGASLTFKALLRNSLLNDFLGDGWVSPFPPSGAPASLSRTGGATKSFGMAMQRSRGRRPFYERAPCARSESMDGIWPSPPELYQINVHRSHVKARKTLDQRLLRPLSSNLMSEVIQAIRN